ncbi:MAG TPA: hypothetical protein VMT45_06820 [Thermoanaerobaculaceae bacterium]|nr:hypothetical protein [Thermoanaerobaculaceae bacterium]
MKPIPWEITLAQVVLALLLFLLWAAVRWTAAGRDHEKRRRFRSDLTLALLGVGVFTVYLSNSKRLIQVDTQLATFAAISLIENGDLDVDEFRPLIDPLLVASVKGPDGRSYSYYPPGSTLACLPFMFVPVIAKLAPSLVLLDIVAKLTAASWTALAVMLLFSALRRYAPAGALVATLAFAFGTAAFSSASQDLWQHGPSMVGLALALLLIARDRETAGSGLLLGAAFGWTVTCRAPLLLPVLVLFLVAFLRRRRVAVWAVLGALPFALLTVWVNVLTSGSPFVFAQAKHLQPGSFETPLFEGLAGLLFAPSRGLFVYSPFLLLALVGAARELKSVVRGEGTVPLGTIGLAAAVPLLLLVATWTEWFGGWSYGYRIICEASLLLTPAFAAFVGSRPMRLGLRGVVLVLVGFSFAVQSLQVYFPDDSWNASHVVKRGLAGAWNLRPSDTQIAWHLQAIGKWLRAGEQPARATSPAD